MRRFVTTEDIRELAEVGEFELMMREGTVLTDAALDEAHRLGVRLVEGSRLAAPRPAEVDRPSPGRQSRVPPPSRVPSPTVTPRDAAPAQAGPTQAAGPRFEGLPDPARMHPKLLIDGEFRDATGGATNRSVDPATNETIVEVASATTDDIDLAVGAARRAFREWRVLDPAERADLLLKVAERIEREHEFLAKVESQDVGRPIRETTLIDLPASWDPFRFFQGLVRAIDGRVLALPQDSLDYVRKEPMGVVGMIIPWNFPLHIACRKSAAALAAGNTVVLKPPELAPLSSIELGRICLEAGLPPGVFNVVPGAGEVAGQALVEHRGVDKIAFTGSTVVGRSVMRGSAGTIKRVSLELGGKSPSIVFADADLERAVSGTLFGIYLAQGQVCSAGSRILVERSVYDEFVERFAARAAAIRIGLPWRWRTQLGPLVNERQMERVYEYVEIGQAEGATVLGGGTPPDDPELARGNFIRPTAFVNVEPGFRIAQEEIFGPVAVVMPFSGEEEAVRLANDVRYGLAAGIWTTDVGRAHRVARDLEAGSIWVNHFGVYPSEAPFGGYKESGTGHDLGLESLHEYMETKNVHVNIGRGFNDWYEDN
ncbi:MAG: aldehyde dehydrogenase family protein [bacterium]|nr:aldehyde dehydrogenase family protein [bacterium]